MTGGYIKLVYVVGQQASPCNTKQCLCVWFRTKQGAARYAGCAVTGRSPAIGEILPVTMSAANLPTKLGCLRK